MEAKVSMHQGLETIMIVTVGKEEGKERVPVPWSHGDKSIKVVRHFSNFIAPVLGICESHTTRQSGRGWINIIILKHLSMFIHKIGKAQKRFLNGLASRERPWWSFWSSISPIAIYGFWNCSLAVPQTKPKLFDGVTRVVGKFNQVMNSRRLDGDTQNLLIKIANERVRDRVYSYTLKRVTKKG